MNNKILIVGTYFDKAKSYDWWQELPNLSDYETIILDTTRILQQWLYGGRVQPISRNRYLLSDKNEHDDKIQANIRLVRRKLIELIEFDVTIYVLYAPTVTIDYIVQIGNYAVSSGSRESVKFISTNDWCPLSVETYSEKGKIIHVKDESFKLYFRDFKEWEFYFVSDTLNIDDLERHYEKRWKAVSHLSDIAINNVNKPLAVEFQPYFHNWAYDEFGQEEGWRVSPDTYGGRLILLPVINSYDTKPHIESLLQKIGLFEVTPPPDWVHSIEIPGEATIKEDIEIRKRELYVLTSEINEKESSLSELQKYKQLLFETGENLQELVRVVLEHLGARIEPSPVSDEFIISFNDRKALVEVKGNTKSIAKDDLGQLITDLGEYLKEAGGDIDGILIGNAWRLDPLEIRDTHDKPIFTQTVTKIAKNRNIGLLSTIELFRAYCKVLEDPTCKEDILNKIIGGKGVIKL